MRAIFASLNTVLLITFASYGSAFAAGADSAGTPAAPAGHAAQTVKSSGTANGAMQHRGKRPTDQTGTTETESTSGGTAADPTNGPGADASRGSSSK